MTVSGNPRSFHKKFKFIVEIDDVGHAGFQKCSELSVEVANVQYFEGATEPTTRAVVATCEARRRSSRTRAPAA